jgi:hypothetical protein
VDGAADNVGFEITVFWPSPRSRCRHIGELLTFDRLTILGAATAAAVKLVAVALPPSDPALTALVGDRGALTFLAIWTLGAIPVAIAMPLVRGRFFGRMWQDPRLAFVIPRWLVRLVAGAILGGVAASITVAVLIDYRISWLAASESLAGGGFCAGAWLRLRHRPDAEWGSRCWPRI